MSLTTSRDSRADASAMSPTLQRDEVICRLPRLGDRLALNALHAFGCRVVLLVGSTAACLVTREGSPFGTRALYVVTNADDPRRVARCPAEPGAELVLGRTASPCLALGDGVAESHVRIRVETLTELSVENLALEGTRVIVPVWGLKERDARRRGGTRRPQLASLSRRP